MTKKKYIHVAHLANVFIRNHDRTPKLTVLKLNQLLYFAYGLLVIQGYRFDEEPEAWKSGVIFKSVYIDSIHWDMADRYINTDQEKINSVLTGGEIACFTTNQDALDIVDSVIKKLGMHDQYKLAELSQANGGAWKDCYNNETKRKINIYQIEDYFNSIKNFFTFPNCTQLIVPKIEP